MPKVRKVKRRKTYKVSINRKRLRNKLRKVPTITCRQIKNAWDVKKSTKSNLVQMGLAYDPNLTLKIPNAKGELLKTTKQKATGELDAEEIQERRRKTPKKVQVAQQLEAEAKAPRERMFRLPKGQVHFLTYLMDKHGDDYKAMSRDKKNYYQLTWKQIRQKINVFKGIPEQYAEYLLQKGDIVLDDPTPLDVTKKRMAEENLKKHCAPKKPKKSIVGQWIEETIEDTDEKDAFDTLETIGDSDVDEVIKKKNSTETKDEKKLQLFSDDDSDSKCQNSKSKTSTKSKINSHNADKTKKRAKLLEKSASSDSEDSEELEGDDEEVDFKNLSDVSEDELSEDDILDDGEFVTDSDEESD